MELWPTRGRLKQSMAKAKVLTWFQLQHFQSQFQYHMKEHLKKQNTKGDRVGLRRAQPQNI